MTAVKYILSEKSPGDSEQKKNGNYGCFQLETHVPGIFTEAIIFKQNSF